jgi:hypothetical protein
MKATILSVVYRTIDENGLPNLYPIETTGYITKFYKMSLDTRKHYLWTIPDIDI